MEVKDRITSKNTPYKLSKEMIQSMNAAEEDVKCGRTNTHDQIMLEMKEWIEEK